MKLEAGQKFADVDLPDHTGRARRLTELAGGDPVVLLFSRGWWCPKEQSGKACHHGASQHNPKEYAWEDWNNRSRW